MKTKTLTRQTFESIAAAQNAPVQFVATLSMRDPLAKLLMELLRSGLLCPYPGRSTEMTRMLCSARTAALNIPLSSLLPDGLHWARPSFKSIVLPTANCQRRTHPQHRAGTGWEQECCQSTHPCMKSNVVKPFREPDSRYANLRPAARPTVVASPSQWTGRGTGDSAMPTAARLMRALRR